MHSAVQQGAIDLLRQRHGVNAQVIEKGARIHTHAGTDDKGLWRAA